MRIIMFMKRNRGDEEFIMKNYILNTGETRRVIIAHRSVKTPRNLLSVGQRKSPAVEG